MPDLENRLGAASNKVVMKVLVPTGVTPETRNGLAPRLDGLAGKRIGLVWNQKAKANVLLRMVGDLLQERYPTAKMVELTVSSCCTPPKEGELEAIAAKVDAAIYASAD